jgi:Ferritin-like domain
MIRRSNKRPQMAITEAELSSMTQDLDSLHQETFPSVRKSLDEFSANIAGFASNHPTGRRGFLAGLGGVAIIGGVAACSSSKGSKGSSTSNTPATSGAATSAGTSSSAAPAATYTGDLKVVALAAALENLAVTAYKGALAAAAKGTLGTVPPAVATFVQTAMKQHADHAAAWNAVLTKSKLPAITGTPLTITADQVAMLNAAKSVPDVAKLALNLENAAADTYTFAAANVTDVGGIMTAATIQPVETMHAAILSFILGEYPVPLAFIGTDKAVMPSAFTG